MYMGVGVDVGVGVGVGVDLGVTTYTFDDGSAVQECAQEGGVGLGEGR